MAKMHFKYASMNSGKSIDLIRTAHNYEENGYKVLIMKPAVDTKGEDYITSRIGLSRKVDELLLYSDDIIKKLENKLKDISCILIDEAQFLSIKQVDDLFLISKACDMGLEPTLKWKALQVVKDYLNYPIFWKVFQLYVIVEK